MPTTQFSTQELKVIEGVEGLMKDYLRAYIHADKEAFSKCFHKDVSLAVGEEFLSREDLRSQRADSEHYFDKRIGHWSPPNKTVVSISPINEVLGMAQVNWSYPPTSTGLEYTNTSMYVCVLSKESWKIHMVVTPRDSGKQFQYSHRLYLEWNVEQWPIHLNP